MLAIANAEEVASSLEPLTPDGEPLLELVATTGALLRGHFALQGGEHSEWFIRFAQLGRSRKAVAQVAKALHTALEIPNVNGVITPESGGFFLGNAMATLLGVDLVICAIDAERRPTKRVRIGNIVEGKTYLVINDVVTTARSLEPMISAVTDAKASIAGIGVFAALQPDTFSRFLYERRLDGRHLLSSRWKPTSPELCSACAKKLPLLPAGEFN